MVNERSDKEYEHPPTSELPENKLRYNFRLGDMIWVKQNDSSWWAAQVIDEARVGSKPKKKAKHDCLVRLYGTCQYLYVDPWKSNAEFRMMLKQERKSASEVFSEVLEKELSRVNSSSDYEEDENSEGAQTKVTTEKTSCKRVRKQECLKQCSYKSVKKSATAENLEDESEDQDQEFGNTATTGATAKKAKRGRGRKSSSSHDTVQTINTDSCGNSAESLRGKKQKQVGRVLYKEGCKIGASVVRREGLRRSGEDRTVSLADASASEDATEDSMVAETSAPHTEIKAMVRDILFKEIIDREHDAEMAYIDEVINGMCSTTVDSMTGDATASTMRREIKGETYEATKNTMQVTSPGIRNHTTTNINPKNDSVNPLKEMKDVTDITSSRVAAMKELGQVSPRQIRQIRIMQSLGLIAPSGSPFGKSIVVAATRQ